MTAQIVLSIIGVLLLLIAAFDIYLACDKEPRNTITQAIIDANKKQPLLGWFIGFLMGALTIHFFEG